MTIPQRRTLTALAAAALAAGVADVAVVLSSHHRSDRGLFAALTLVLGWSFVGTGIYAWAQRPHSRMGPLMAGVGLAWFINPLQFSDSSWPSIIGSTFGAIPIAMLAHLMLAFPDGRLHDRLERRVVAWGYVTATLLPLLASLVTDTANSPDCPGCPPNPILISGTTAGADAMAAIVNVSALSVIVFIVVLMRRRWKSSSPAQRRGLGPVIWAGILTFAGFAVLFGAEVATGQDAAEGTVRRILFVGLLLIFASVPFAFLTGFMRMRLQRAHGVGQIVDWLATRGDRSLRDLLAEALRHPELEVAYWLPERERWADAEGRPVQLPPEGSGKVATPIDADGKPIAVVITDAELVEEHLLVKAVGPALSLAMENERLAAALRARVEELRASRARIVRAGEEERQRLERDLHDGAQQRLVALALNLKLARVSMESDPQGALELVDDAIAELIEATAELRELARGIHPAVLTDRGLEAAVTALSARAPVPVELLALPEERLAAPVESTAYFVVAEALTNVARYAHATHAEVEITRDDGLLVVEVRDDGVGGADPAQGSGLRGLADRVGAVDGRIDVESARGAGTTVRVEIPCAR
ncbi:MAG: sensor histidine kinase [Solirubrobacteraceae bacterium]